MEASGPKWVKPVLNTIGVNSLRLGDLHIINHGEFIKYIITLKVRHLNYSNHQWIHTYIFIYDFRLIEVQLMN